MRKWRDMERQMEPTSQMFTQGGIRRRDWFSDRLQGGGRAEPGVEAQGERSGKQGEGGLQRAAEGGSADPTC